MLKTALITLSMLMALGMYIPLFHRMYKRKHTRDFSMTFQWLCFLVQINNGILAAVEHAPFLVCWYVVQTVFTGATLWFVHHYWNRLPPPIPAEILQERQQPTPARLHSSSRILDI